MGEAGMQLQNFLTFGDSNNQLRMTPVGQGILAIAATTAIRIQLRVELLLGFVTIYLPKEVPSDFCGI